MDTALEFLNMLAGKGVKLSVEAEQLNCYAPPDSLTDDVKDGIARFKPEIMRILGHERAQPTPIRTETGRTAADATEFPLSAGGKTHYILQKLNPERSNAVPICFEMSREADLGTLERAWECVLEQYPILTARIVEKEGVPYHHLDPGCKSTIQRPRLESGDPQQLLDYLQNRVLQEFDLNEGPLTRFDLIQRDGQSSVLLIVVHHVIFDGVSAGILLRALFQSYAALRQGRQATPATVFCRYPEFVAWEDRMLASEDGRRHAEYWRQQLDGELPGFKLIPDLQPPAPGQQAGVIVADLPEELAKWARGFSQSHSLQPSAIFLGVFQLLLHKYTNQNDVIVLMPTVVRPGDRFAGEIGYFFNVVPIRTRFDERMPPAEYMRNVQGTMLDALFHSSYPFSLMLNKQRQIEENSPFKVFYAYQNFLNLLDSSALPLQDELALAPLDGFHQKPEGDFDLILEVYEDGDSFRFELQGDPGLYSGDTMRAMFGHYCTLLKEVSKNPGVAVQACAMLTEQERTKLLLEYNDTRAPYPRDKCIHELFVEQVERNPDKIAVAFGEDELSYQQLHDRCCDLAMYLQAEGVAVDSAVGLCVERSLEMMVGIMGTVRAGAAYLPLDPAYPDDRLVYMVGDCATTVVLTQEKFKGKLEPLLPAHTKLLALDAEWPAIARRVAGLKAAGVALRNEVRPDNVNYVIYTSGSTGKPKGVLVEHRALVNRINWMQKCYPLGADDVVLQKTPYSFDVSVWEFFWPMMAGASIVFAAPEGHMDVHYLEGLINSKKVTTLHYVPSMLHTFLDNARVGCGTVTQIFCSGEALDRGSVDRYRSKFPNAVLHNLYGPTEAAIDVTAYDCSQLEYPFVPIGAPIDNTQIYILDPHGNPQPVGVPGELHIAGDNLARGYLNRPELTQEKFVANPFVPGTRMYRTGDLSRWLEDGNIQYLGRIDVQVKIGGVRIETGEIESHLNRHPLVSESVVIAQGRDGYKQLIAFYRAKDEAGGENTPLPHEELRTHLLKTLPEYMVPAVFVSLDAIPLSANGKVDRRALEGLQVAVESSHEYVAPRNDTERQLVEIWAQIFKEQGFVLEKAQIGINDDFFELGGNSLLATQLIYRIRSQLGLDLPVRVLFEQTSIAQLAQLVAGTEKSTVPAIEPVDRGSLDHFPLSYAQERLWFIDQLDPGNTGYNLFGAVTIRGDLDVGQLEQAFNRIIARHESLRTIFPHQEGQAQQLVLDRLDFKVECIDLRHYKTRKSRDNKARRLCQSDATTPFDLATGPLIRSKAIRLAEDEHLLMLNMHHIISDGWSLGVLIRELGAMMESLRQGQQPDLAPLPIQYVDYAVWQRKWLDEGGVLERQLAYWQEKLAGVPETLDLVTDYPRPSVQSLAGAQHAFALDAQLTGQLRHLAEQHGCTLYMVLLAAFKALLYRYTGQEDICVGSPIANRQYGETEGLIGMFVNTLALRSQVRGDAVFADLLASVKTTCLEAYEHQDTPFEKIVDAVQPQRNRAVSPLFQVMLALQNADPAEGSQYETYPLENGTSKFDLSIYLAETAQGLAGTIEYGTALYQQQTIARMADHFVALCRAIVVAPGVKIHGLDYIDEAEKRRVQVDFNDTRADYPADKCIHELFVEQAAATPDHTAVVFGDAALSYRQLQSQSHDLALYLQSLGVGPESVVGLCMERSLEMVVGLLAILQAGGAYVPLDPAYPESRLGYMLNDSRAAIVLTQSGLRDKLSTLAPAGTLVLDVQSSEIGDRMAELKAKGIRLQRQVTPQHLAYVIYTSGSTGEPKGVAIEHHSPVALVHWARGVYSREELAGVLASTSICFDLSVYEIFLTLAVGGKIILVPSALGLVDLPDQASVTLINTVPSVMEELVLLGAIPESVRTINLAGERLAPALVDKLYAIGSVKKVYDLYGPSEDTTYSTCALRGKGGTPTIGRPIANTQVHIVDEHDNMQPIGVPGELCIAGDGLARGYLHRPQLTQERFVDNPFAPGTRMYRTGDLARWREDGNIEYLGRIDAQVKIRGFRIETGEIEARLKQHPQIQDCAVIAQGQGVNRQLVAFCRTMDTEADGPGPLPQDEFRAYLAATLPDYMLPAVFTRVAAIPLTPNGKVDRRALARTDVTIETGLAYAAPRNQTERDLVDIWSQVFEIAADRIGVNDNFFELGGNSLLAVRLTARINQRFAQMFPMATLFVAPSVAAIAKHVTGAAVSSTGIAVPMRRGSDRLPMFAVPGAGGNVLSLKPLAEAVGRQQPFYGLEAVGLDGNAEPLTSVEETAAANVAAMREIQPTGPYTLIGHSYGGVVAYEMARILLDESEAVGRLILLDSYAPSMFRKASVVDEVADLCEVASAIARLYDVDVTLDVKRLRRLKQDTRVRAVFEALAAAGVDADVSQFTAAHAVYRANLQAYRNYKPAPLPRQIEARLYRANEDTLHGGMVFPPDYGWKRLLKNGLQIHSTAANHFSIRQGAYIEEIAATFSDAGQLGTEHSPG